MKHSKNELRYVMYRVLVGATYGSLIGLFLVHPLAKKSPYVMRKLWQSIRPSDMSPLKYPKLMLRSIIPYYATAGGVTGGIYCFWNLFFTN
mmetsp:Transcript_30262/g.5470  ORF Transcript_30262/g.5470 Transcript_30262/m.5470 type:complete len:91 (+) Transcript_30262:392-664(+)